MILFAIIFGLSMDYEVFLLSRVREEYVRTNDAVESVADGLATTARVITAAAAIMVVVFGSFVVEDDRIVKMLGLGLAVAVLLDVTLIRMLLVPATMELLGARNWWMPDWLDRIVPPLSVEGTGRHDDAPAPDEPDEPDELEETRARTDTQPEAPTGRRLRHRAKPPVELLDSQPRDRPGNHQLLDLLGAHEDVVSGPVEFGHCLHVVRPGVSSKVPPYRARTDGM